jgi:hypothetical protein
MRNATSNANSVFNSNRALGHFYGNLGDSIERRYGGGHSLLGGGSDAFQGTFGPGSAWNAQGFGNYFGTGLINGVGSMFSGVHSHGHGGFTYLKRFSSQSSFNHAIIAQCMMAYLGYGVVRNVIDTYANFAAEGVAIDHPLRS